MLIILRLLKYVDAAFSCMRTYLLDSAIYLTVSCLLVTGAVAVHAQTTARDVVLSPIPTLTRHLRIAYGITNTQYRQQLTELTPLGSSYEQVKSFIRAELQTEVYPSDSILDFGLTVHRHTLASIDVQTRLIRGEAGFTGLSRQCLVEEPAHTHVVFAKHSFLEGTALINAYFTAKPSPLGSWIELFTVYIFDRKQKLIDIYCFAHGRSSTLP